MKIDINRMTAKDLDEVLEIEKKVFSDPWTKQAFLSDLNNKYAHPFVAYFENRVVGYVSLYQATGELQIGNMAISPDFHRRGIGSLIMEYILEMAAEMKTRLLLLEVRLSNEAARKLYLKFGFKEAGYHKYYYRKPTEDALIMVRGVD